MTRTSDTAILLGNGPSADKFDPALCAKVDVFGTNFVGVKFPVWGCTAKAVIITDSSRIEEIGKLYKDSPVDLYVGDQRYVRPAPNIEAILGRKFYPITQLSRTKLPGFSILRKFKHTRGLMREVMFLRTQYSFDREAGFNFGNSVIIASLQLLVSLGYKRILLSGVDTRYRTSKDYLEGVAERTKWVWDDFVKNPRLFMEPHLVTLQILAEAVGVEIIDCTPDGALRFIKKGKFLADAPFYATIPHSLS
jgi:hypothetical protein